MFASKYGHTNIVQLLLEHGADANFEDEVSSSANIVCECLPHCCAPGIRYNYYNTMWLYNKLSLLPYQGNSLSVA